MIFLTDPSLAIGMMSGTSMDGVDCALIESDAYCAKAAGKPIHIPYDPILRHEIAVAMAEAVRLGHPSMMTAQLYALERKITDIHGQAVLKILAINGLVKDNISVIGFHGQTLFHKPHTNKPDVHKPKNGFSWQIGDGQRLANITQIPVVNDFRAKDVAFGGQGAPLVPIYHQALLKAQDNPNYPIAIINIGGVSNITWIGGEREDQMLAFDTGPGNAFMDDWIECHTGEAMDIDGQIAQRGEVNHALVAQWLAHSYFSKTPPKSLDRYSFDVNAMAHLTLEDGAATLLEFTVKSIHLALTHCPENPKHIYVCGGGRLNKTLMSALDRIDAPVSGIEQLGLQGDFIEAEAFAFLACRHMAGLPITFPRTTGITQSSPGGVLYQPEKD